jgi:signal peptidase II
MQNMSFKYKILLIVAPMVFLLDQITKALVRMNVAQGGAVTIIPGYFDIVHIMNKGAAFGMFSESGAGFRKPFFYIVAVVAVIVIFAVIVKLSNRDRLSPVIFSLILGGIAGNVTDRLRFGSVTDFLSVHIRDEAAGFTLFGRHFSFDLTWPAFNVADSAITVAMVLLVWSMIRGKSEVG